MPDLLLSRPFTNKRGIRPGTPTIKAIMHEVCDAYGITITEMIGTNRARYLAWPRQEAYYRCVKETGRGYAEIARVFNRDRTSVVYGVYQHAERMRGKAA